MKTKKSLFYERISQGTAPSPWHASAYFDPVTNQRVMVLYPFYWLFQFVWWLQMIWCSHRGRESWIDRHSEARVKLAVEAAVHGLLKNQHDRVKTMRTEHEIQMAHDILGGVIDHKALIDRKHYDMAHASKNTLCWVLLHDSGESFAKLIGSLKGHMEQHGFVLHKPSEN